MDDYGILTALKSHGPLGAILIVVGGIVGKWAKAKIQDRSVRVAQDIERQRQAEVSDRAERHLLIEQQAAANKRTLDILEKELKTQQDVSGKMFEVLDRNTRAVEKAVERLADLAQEQIHAREQLGRIEGAVQRPGNA